MKMDVTSRGRIIIIDYFLNSKNNVVCNLTINTSKHIKAIHIKETTLAREDS